MRRPDTPLDHASFPIDEFELGEPQEIARMIEPLSCSLGGDLIVFAQEGWQFELPQMMRQQNLRRCGAVVSG